jgi:pimeloyl-ACP methyl ester carboxylesterase
MAATNIVLVHGAWVDASSWSRVITILQAAGYSVLAPQLPLTSLDDDIAVTKAALASLTGPTILVGHSYGGVVISGAGSEADNVSGLVYVAAYALDEGESVFDINQRFPATACVQHIRPSYLPNTIWIDPAAFPRFFAPDIDPALARVLAVVQKPQSLAGGVLSNPAWKNLPCWYVVSSNDQIIHPQAEQWMAERIGATISSLAASHASPLSHPQEIAQVIISAAKAKAQAQPS